MAGKGVQELVEDLDSKLGNIHLPEAPEDRVAADVDKELSAAKAADVSEPADEQQVHKAGALDSTASDLATSIDAELWSEHSMRKNKGKTGSKLDQLARASDAMDEVPRSLFETMQLNCIADD